MLLLFLLYGIFTDESVHCLELGSECYRDEYRMFLNDDDFPPGKYSADDPVEYESEETGATEPTIDINLGI